ncbi:hypothetical protein HWB90_gp118 [Mycobacterium phage Fowlmouth]|uniref:Uncharacterized protein n=2 Tax=Fowlmouthvirus fowlmouth TaxID=2845652 RepID=A0A7G8LPW2_9CAUD|nr:hypothetical protein HWB90_gp118 [Mycobacterium phage Fowlmouth]AYN58021.1 hypothetical protein SEA_FOWLMOUTH_72 [Mycobacterium phage Fowlmouth]QNJ59284.1 hypothetical protein SEA_MRMIYAGI_71 [Mycobacterium phage MrMiyagi]
MSENPTETSDFVTLTKSQYERLMADHRKLKAIRETVEEYRMTKKLIAAHISAGHLHRLRRKALSKITLLLQSKV